MKSKWYGLEGNYLRKADLGIPNGYALSTQSRLKKLFLVRAHYVPFY